MAKNMEKEHIHGVMNLALLAIGMKIRQQDMEYIYGKMEGNMKDSGVIIICMEKVNTLGLMVESMKENT